VDRRGIAINHSFRVRSPLLSAHRIWPFAGGAGYIVSFANASSEVLNREQHPDRHVQGDGVRSSAPAVSSLTTMRTDSFDFLNPYG